MAEKTFTLAEVQQHNKPDDAWVIVDGVVYDVTNFADEHPGGKKILLAEAGKDASEKFELFHGGSVIDDFGPELKVGIVSPSAKL
mmetsp:Transcript_8896/g.24955  ORF Transcript_8896/g.24955 Transcript_8896/m.24955 type:complete len:85 (+) Transcript_8896:86-340(+)|eukprot:CAMPEP_0119123538 /NCGR_PEP_ID=MMETSP1310-20130426/3455_1 /TAXON_ID=464262 /ORGANISM="Genus nov. species nov., Strain RCC2339" /LENGTH=84 /DNA_ID=CAMNT_0007113375 /DNA_START=95 /DNA_END=349 /DNA_ORIENTATION=+